MDLKLTAEWLRFSEDDDDLFLRIGGLIACVYDMGDVWAWEVRTTKPDDTPGRIISEGDIPATPAWVDCRADAKTAAEDFIRKHLGE